MQHKGAILEAIVRKRATNISSLARDLEYDRATPYRHFADPDLEDGIILKYAKALKYDFRKEFPSLASYSGMLQEPVGDYRPLTLTEALKEADIWRQKYIDLMERHSELLAQMLKEATK